MHQSNYHLREESKKDCQEESTQNKADKLLTSLQISNQSRRQTKKLIELKSYTISYSVIEISQYSQVNMS